MHVLSSHYITVVRGIVRNMKNCVSKLSWPALQVRYCRGLIGNGIIHDRVAHRTCLLQRTSTFIDRLLERGSDSIVSIENLSGNDLRYKPWSKLNKWLA